MVSPSDGFDGPSFLDFVLSISHEVNLSDVSCSSFERNVLAGHFSAMSQTQNFDHAVFCSSVPENYSIR